MIQKHRHPFFRYTADDGKQHEVWFEDARSIQAKFDLIKELNIRGMSYWKLGLAFPQNWLLIVENFNVRKTGDLNKILFIQKLPSIRQFFHIFRHKTTFLQNIPYPFLYEIMINIVICAISIELVT